MATAGMITTTLAELISIIRCCIEAPKKCLKIKNLTGIKKTPIKKLFFTLDPCWGRWIPRGACNETPIGEKVLPARAAVQLDNGDIFLKVSHDWIL